MVLYWTNFLNFSTMNYTISTTKRNLLIFSAAFLTGYTLYNAFFLFGIKPGGVKPGSAELIIRSLLTTIPHVYILYLLFDYFKHHGWKVLQYTLLVTMIVEILSKLFSMVNFIGSVVPNNFYYAATASAILTISIIVQAIFLLQIKRKDYPDVFSLQKYAVGLILLQVIAFGIPVLIRSEDSNSMMLVIRILSAIPYLFLIEFALKQTIHQGNLVSDSAV